MLDIKWAINGFIGILAKNYTTNTRLYFTADRETALKEWLNNPEEVKFNGIYDNEKDIHNYMFMENEGIQSMIDKAMSRSVKGTCEPLVWMVNVSKTTPLYINALPIQRKVMDVANMMLYKVVLYILSLNPHAQLVRVKADLLGYINITNEIETDDYTWGEIKATKRMEPTEAE
jgi:hypothetical protein